MKGAIFGLLIFALLVGAIGTFWYLTSPYYTLQLIGTALSDRDSQRFYRHVDVPTIVTNLTSEIIYEPAMKTPRLSQFQRTIVNGSIGVGKDTIDRALINRIDRFFHPSIRSNVPHGDNQYIELCSDDAEYPDGYTLVDTTGESIGAFAKELGKELTGESAELKRQVYQRMIYYAETHRDTLIGAIFAAPTKGMPMQQMCENYGFELKEIRSLTFGGSDTEQTGTLVFYSPKVRKNVALLVDLVRPGGDMFAPWQIRKFRDLRQTFLDLGEDTDRQVQDMVAYSVEGMTQQNVFRETGNVLKRLGRSDAAKNLLQNLKNRFR